MMKRLNQKIMYRTPAIPPTHRRAVTAASRRMRQRSRATTSARSRHGSTGGACRATRSCKPRINSCSPMMAPPLHHAPQGALGKVKPRPDGAQRAAGDAGDVLVGHALDEAKQEHLPMFRPQPTQGGVDVLGVLGREVV